MEIRTTTTIGKWGNSAGVRIANEIMEAAHLSVNDRVEVTEVNGGIFIKPEKKRDLREVFTPCFSLPKDWKFDREEANERR